MKALTIWQPWASLIIIGAKPYEFRRWAAPRSLIGERFVIHAATRKIVAAEIAELIEDLDNGALTLGARAGIGKALELLDAYSKGDAGKLPIAAGLGTAVLGRPRPVADLFRARMDVDELDPDMWGWPVGEIEAWSAPIPATGAQGFWEWSPAPRANPTGHTCHAIACEAEVPPRKLMCARHWRMVPKPLQQDVWREYRPGQERTKDPSRAYLTVAQAAIDHVARREGRMQGALL